MDKLPIFSFYFQETRRKQQAEAAEKRMKANEGRGVKNPEALKRKQQRQAEAEQAASSPQGEGLRVKNYSIQIHQDKKNRRFGSNLIFVILQWQVG